MKKNWIRRVLRGIGLTSVMFVFQACYGTPQDFGFDLLVEGKVKSKNSGMPIQGIKVSVADTMQYELTDDEGNFSFYTKKTEGLKLQFQDIDSSEHGLYIDTDTVVNDMNDKIYVDIALEEK